MAYEPTPKRIILANIEADVDCYASPDFIRRRTLAKVRFEETFRSVFGRRPDKLTLLNEDLNDFKCRSKMIEILANDPITENQGSFFCYKNLTNEASHVEINIFRIMEKIRNFSPDEQDMEATRDPVYVQRRAKRFRLGVMDFYEPENQPAHEPDPDRFVPGSGIEPVPKKKIMNLFKVDLDSYGMTDFLIRHCRARKKFKETWKMIFKCPVDPLIFANHCIEDFEERVENLKVYLSMDITKNEKSFYSKVRLQKEICDYIGKIEKKSAELEEYALKPRFIDTLESQQLKNKFKNFKLTIMDFFEQDTSDPEAEINPDTYVDLPELE